MAISKDMQGTFHLGAVFSKSFKAFGRRAFTFIILSSIAHIIVPTFSYFVLVHYTQVLAVSSGWEAVSVVDFLSVIIGYGAIIYGVLQDLVGRQVPQIAHAPRLMQASLRSRDWIIESMAEAVAIAARRLAPLVRVLVLAWVVIWLVTVLPVSRNSRYSASGCGGIGS
jgi:hypothetical protein